jgi:hypothetical protein
MLSPRNGKLRYLKHRSTNAYRLLRQGRFRVFRDMLKMEFDLQFGVLRDRIKGSSAELSTLDSEYIDKRKLRPPGYQPTTLKPAAYVAMQADPEAVRQELSRILSSLNVRAGR